MTEFKELPFVYQAEATLHIKWWAQRGIVVSEEKFGEVLKKEALRIWNERTYDKNNILNLLSNHNEKRGSVEKILARLLHYRNHGKFGDVVDEMYRGYGGTYIPILNQVHQERLEEIRSLHNQLERLNSSAPTTTTTKTLNSISDEIGSLITIRISWPDLQELFNKNQENFINKNNDWTFHNSHLSQEFDYFTGLENGGKLQFSWNWYFENFKKQKRLFIDNGDRVNGLRAFKFLQRCIGNEPLTITQIEDKQTVNQELNNKDKEINNLNSQIDNLKKRPTQEQLEQVKNDLNNLRKERDDALKNAEKHTNDDLKPVDLPTDWKEQLVKGKTNETDLKSEKDKNAKLAKDLEDSQNNLTSSKEEVNNLKKELGTKEVDNTQLKSDLQKEKARSGNLQQLNTQLINNLKDWTTTFPNSTPAQVKARTQGTTLTAEQQEVIDNWDQFKEGHLENLKKSITDKINHLISQFGDSLGLTKQKINDVYKQDYELMLDDQLTWENRNRANDYSNAVQNLALKITFDLAEQKHKQYKGQVSTLSDVRKQQMNSMFTKLFKEITTVTAANNKNNPFYNQQYRILSKEKASVRGHHNFWQSQTQNQEPQQLLVIEVPTDQFTSGS